ncbi:enolase-phosphatase e1 [Fusarium austroafricanum]|uniref:Enolase-phosphatase e1 n=1 Tax=Fusarium austroafricanum TaxID=2364996 RepID=A0A8H4JLX1_9HYPO|nr:enolase-phosphatase e1 [Fusarium austroafricanum]
MYHLRPSPLPSPGPDLRMDTINFRPSLLFRTSPRPPTGLRIQLSGIHAEPSPAKLRKSRARAAENSDADTLSPAPFILFTDFACFFPYALEALPKVLDQEWDSPEFAKYRDAFPEEHRNSRSDFETHVRDLVKRDVKIAYLKSLQGYLWLQGYKSGNIVAPLFPDVEFFLNEATQAGKKIIIYSSGSVPAQKLLFSHTNSEKPDVTPLIADYFDTTNAGPKTEVESYTKIISRHPEHKNLNRWLFLSDNINEVKAAVGAGMRSLPVVRPGNAPLPPDEPLSKLAITEFKHSELASLGV